MKAIARAWLGALLLAAAASASASASATAGAERWPGWVADSFRSLGTAEGLPNPVAIAVAEDTSGFLWVGTLSGVARWDGYRFRAGRGDSTAGAAASPLPDNVVQLLFRDAAGRLWVGTNAAGLLRLTPDADGNEAGAGLAQVSAGPQGLAHASVRALADDGQGGLWVGSDGGLDHLDPASGRVRREPMGPAAANGLRGASAVALLRDRRGRLWVGTTAGLFVREAGASLFRTVPLGALATTAGLAVSPELSVAASPEQPRPEALLEDSAGRIWIGTNRHGAFVLDAEGASPRQVLETALPARAKALPTRRVMALAEARPGEVWAGTLGEGIVAIDAASGRTRRLGHDPLSPSSLPDNHVRGLHRDRSGLVWVATYGGVARVDPRASAVLHVSAERLNSDPARSRLDYSAVLAHSDGRLWTGTLGHGVEIVDPRSGAVQRLRPDPQRPGSALPPDAAVGLAEAPDGSVFIGNYRGLYRAWAAGRGGPRAASAARVARVTWPGRAPDSGTGALLRDGPRLWVGGLSDGLWLLDIASGQARAVLTEPDRQLTDRRITTLALGRAGELWIGTRNGLNRYDPARGAVQQILPEAPTAAPDKGDAPGPLASGFVSSLHVDGQGRLWVGTYGGGLHRLEAGGDGQQPPRFSRIATAQGLPDDNINAVTEDAAGRIWVSADSGLGLVDPATLQGRSLRRAEGADFLTYWTGAVTRTDAGELVFGAAGGLAVVRPDLLAPWTYRPPVVVTTLRVGGRVQPLPAPGQPLQVPAEANRLEVEYAALDYSAPERNRYAHRLVGHDADWVADEAQHRRVAYSQLPPGHYRLQLRGSNRDGVFGDPPLSLPVQVLAAWHQTPWARGGAVLLLLGGLWAVVHLRTRVLQARRQELQRLVDERTAELQAMSLALTEKSRALEEKSRVLEQASISDPLTGLHNRRFLTEQIDTVLAASLRRAQAAGPRPGAAAPGSAAVDTDMLFFLIDVDRFKQVNDEHGHAAGDAVLVQMAQRLKQAMRESDDIVRWGGEEFLAVARDTDRARADELAERIRAGVAGTPFVLPDGRTLALSCSIGHAAWPFVPAQPQAVDWLGVVNLADLGLLAAKRLGRNAWVGLQAGAPAAAPTAAAAADLAARLRSAPRQALQAGEITLSSSHPASDAAAAALAGG